MDYLCPVFIRGENVQDKASQGIDRFPCIGTYRYICYHTDDRKKWIVLSVVSICKGWVTFCFYTYKWSDARSAYVYEWDICLPGDVVADQGIPQGERWKSQITIPLSDHVLWCADTVFYNGDFRSFRYIKVLRSDHAGSTTRNRISADRYLRF